METELDVALDANKLRRMSSAWKDLMLGDPWSVGDLATLVELKSFTAVEEWEAFYYRSGEEREVLVSRWDAATQAMLQDESLVKNDRDFVYGLSPNLRNLNTQFGRTRERLYQKAAILYNHLVEAGADLTIDECFECARLQVICETWHAVVSRKQNTVNVLAALHPQVEYRKVADEMEHVYAVDYEAYVDGQLRYALQFKPEYYAGNATYLLNARQANIRKNQLYKARFGAPVFDVISDHAGNILNTEVLANL